MPTRVPKSRTRFARGLRGDMTNAEEILWRSLRGSGLDGLKFRRQVPIGRYTVDFLCVAHRLVVELDGAPHERADHKAHDAERDAWLRSQGYHVLRLANDLVIGGGDIPLDLIRRTIADIRAGPSPDPASRGHPLPQAAEGRRAEESGMRSKQE